MRCRFILPLALLLALPTLSLCATIPVGLVSFDVLIPAGALPGVNVFDISNFTGDPGFGGFALPPDFPVFTNLTFQNSSLRLDDGVSPFSIFLGDIGPGPFSATGPVQFPSTSTFRGASFTATLNQTTFTLSDGSSFTASSSAITAVILSSAGSSLTAGTDFALISVSSAGNGVPEPATWLLTITVLAAGLSIRQRGGRI